MAFAFCYISPRSIFFLARVFLKSNAVTGIIGSLLVVPESAGSLPRTCFGVPPAHSRSGDRSYLKANVALTFRSVKTNGSEGL
jgi:hypothetical protein